MSELVQGYDIYGKYDKSYSYKYFYFCKNCDAYVGCHPNSKKPLGSLADRNLRNIRHEAHDFFDKLWQDKYFTRSQAYKWLAKKLNISTKKCHIGMFDENLCKKTIDFSRQYLSRYNNKKNRVNNFMHAIFDESWTFIDSNGNKYNSIEPDVKIDLYVVNNVKYYSKGEVKRIVQSIASALGKSQAQLIDEIGEHDEIAPNPKYKNAGVIKLFRCERIDSMIPF